MSTTIDLRSDTVTKPCQAMREAMALAEIGDDVYGEDPTVNLLQKKVATLLGKESALFTPSGSMADQIAVGILTRPGDAVMTSPDSHIAFHEAGATPMLSGVQFSFMPRGLFCADDVRAAYHDNDHHYPPTTLVEVENTYNMGGGQVWPLEQLRDVASAAGELGMNTMLDGARLWNAAVATGHSEAELSEGFDLVTVCLSKGLGAPVGSLIAGSSEHIHRAHRLRKMLGGGMRQAGILAAAGLYALNNGRGRLHLDHENAKQLGQAIENIPGLSIATDKVDSNIVIVEVAAELTSAARLQERCATKGLLFWPTGPQRFRLVTHLDVTGEHCDRAVSILKDTCGE
ncbi:MAG: aminotransferase class I/II-fold pyridoxal phosphate-dependent enzyme [Myxococcales bacterium]|nr:aminotransferase class I/II-fold pyridoxal phosphate-dependent enzyme [Myxococcales bacterium]